MKKTNKKLCRDLSVCLAAKVLLLTALWWLCFNNPITDQQSAQKISQFFQNSSNR